MVGGIGVCVYMGLGARVGCGEGVMLLVVSGYGGMRAIGSG